MSGSDLDLVLSIEDVWIADLSTTAWAREATNELRAAGELSGGGGSAEVITALSPQELQIARLAAEGLSNREIGERLLILGSFCVVDTRVRELDAGAPLRYGSRRSKDVSQVGTLSRDKTKELGMGYVSSFVARPTRRWALAFTISMVAMLTVAVLPSATAGASAGGWQVVASGLDNPRGIDPGPLGTLLVAEAGRVGLTASRAPIQTRANLRRTVSATPAP